MDSGEIPPTVKNVIFDLGGVLFEWSPEKILAAVFAEPAAREAVRVGAFEHPDWQDLDRGTLLEAEAVDRFARRCGRSEAEMLELFREVRRSLKPIAGTVKVLEDLHARGVGLYCLSNMSEACADHLMAEHAFFGRFRGIVISGCVKLIKPDPAIYRHALATFGLQAHETVFVDDRQDNVEAARQVGLRAIRFVCPEQCRAGLGPLLGE